MRVVVLSDTHAPRRWKSCSPAVASQLRGADLILHAGDVCTSAVLDEDRDWARNLLAAGRCTLEGDDPALHTATLSEEDDAAQAVAAYLGALGRPSMMRPFPSDAPAAAIRHHLNQIAVFRLTPER